ncbi:hypothetical protein L7F22_008628 [Adiantum nelumboides]|nr:hypothetical protein [Adiantum nelumboides]
MRTAPGPITRRARAAAGDPGARAGRGVRPSLGRLPGPGRAARRPAVRGEHRRRRGGRPVRAAAAVPHQRRRRRLLHRQGRGRQPRPRRPGVVRQAEPGHLPDGGPGAAHARSAARPAARHRAAAAPRRGAWRGPAGRDRARQRADDPPGRGHADRLRRQRVRDGGRPARLALPDRHRSGDRARRPVGLRDPAGGRRPGPRAALRGPVRRVHRALLRRPPDAADPHRPGVLPDHALLRAPLHRHAVDRVRLPHRAEHLRPAAQAAAGRVPRGARGQRHVHPRPARDRLGPQPLRGLRQGRRDADHDHPARPRLLQGRDLRRRHRGSLRPAPGHVGAVDQDAPRARPGDPARHAGAAAGPRVRPGRHHPQADHRRHHPTAPDDRGHYSQGVVPPDDTAAWPCSRPPRSPGCGPCTAAACAVSSGATPSRPPSATPRTTRPGSGSPRRTWPPRSTCRPSRSAGRDPDVDVGGPRRRRPARRAPRPRARAGGRRAGRRRAPRAVRRRRRAGRRHRGRGAGRDDAARAARRAAGPAAALLGLRPGRPLTALSRSRAPRAPRPSTVSTPGPPTARSRGRSARRRRRARPGRPTGTCRTARSARTSAATSAPGPVRGLAVADLEAQAPVVRLLPSVAGEEAVEAGVGDRGRLGDGARVEQLRGLQLGGEAGQVVDGGHRARARRALQPGVRHPERGADGLVQVLGEPDAGRLGDGAGEHREPGVGVDPLLTGGGADVVGVERQTRCVRDQVPHGRALRAGRVVPVEGALLHGDQRGVGREQLGHRGQTELAVGVARGGEHGAVGGDDGRAHVVDRPVQDPAHRRGELGHDGRCGRVRMPSILANGRDRGRPGDDRARTASAGPRTRPRTAREGTVPLHHETTGSGPPLLLVQGGTAEAGAARMLVGELAVTHRVLTYDRRGVGRSPAGPDPVGPGAHADDAATLLAGTGPSAVVGVGVGAVIGLLLAVRHPDLVTTLVAHEPPLPGLVRDPDHEAGLDRVEELAARDDLGGALRLLTALTSGEDPVEPGYRPEPPSGDPEPALRRFLLHDVPAVRAVRIDPDDVTASGVRVVPPAGSSRAGAGSTAAPRCSRPGSGAGSSSCPAATTGPSHTRSPARPRCAGWSAARERDRARRHLGVALPTVARHLLPARAGPAPRAGVPVPPGHLDRDQRLVLLVAAPGELPRLGRAGPRRVRVRGEGPAVRDAPEAAARRRGAGRELPRLRGARPRPGARPGAVAAPAADAVRRRPGRGVPGPVAVDDGGGRPRRDRSRRPSPRARARRDRRRPPAVPRGRARHESFRDPAFTALLREHGVALVLSDSAGTWPVFDEVTADLVYLRLHGQGELYAGGYTAEALDGWAERIRGWRDAGHDVVCYFDNDAKVHAPTDALALIDRLG